MAYTLTMPHTATAWAHLPGELVRAVRDSRLVHLVERPIHRPELTPEQRAHRIAMERLTRERSSASLGASGWPR